MSLRVTTIIVFAMAFVSAAFTANADTESKADSLVKAKKHFSFAVQYKNSGSYDQAVENYRQSIAYNDTVYQVHYSFADLLLKLEKPAEARREFALALALNPDHYNSATMLARLYYEAAVYDSALTVYETMHRLKPDDRDLLASIAALRDYLGKKEEALNAYLELAEWSNVPQDAIVKAANVASSLERWDTADSLITRALAVDASNRDILRLAFDISIGKNDTNTAFSRLKRLAESDPEDATVAELLEKIARVSGVTDNLIFALEEKHRMNPANAQVVGELVELLFQNNAAEKALKYLKEGIVQSPKDGKLRILMGNYYRDKGDDDRALAEYEIALKDDAWKVNAQQFIWSIRPPKTESEKAEQEFFSRGKKDSSTN